jgi:hypothetical protein
MVVPAAAGLTVDPQHPATTPANAECPLDGAWIICHTSLVLTPVNEPILDFQLPCGTLYETDTDLRRTSPQGPPRSTATGSRFRRPASR